jgi:hypothetical protein
VDKYLQFFLIDIPTATKENITERKQREIAQQLQTEAKVKGINSFSFPFLVLELVLA